MSACPNGIAGLRSLQASSATEPEKLCCRGSYAYCNPWLKVAQRKESSDFSVFLVPDGTGKSTHHSLTVS